MSPSRFAPGSTHGRWTVVRRATPEQRDGCVRPRVVTRCVCGFEAIVWVGDIQRGRSRGCRFASCRHRHDAAQALRKVFPREVVDQLLDVATERDVPVYRLLTEALAGMKVPPRLLASIAPQNRQDAPQQLAEAS